MTKKSAFGGTSVVVWVTRTHSTIIGRDIKIFSKIGDSEKINSL